MPDLAGTMSVGVCQSLTLRGVCWTSIAIVCVCKRLLQTSNDGALTSQGDESRSTSPLTVLLHPPLLPCMYGAHTHTYTLGLPSVTCHFAKDLPALGSQAASATSQQQRQHHPASPRTLLSSLPATAHDKFSALTCWCWPTVGVRVHACVSPSEQIVPSASILLEQQKSRAHKWVHELPGNSVSVITRPSVWAHITGRWPSAAAWNVFMELRKS